MFANVHKPLQALEANEPDHPENKPEIPPPSQPTPTTPQPGDPPMAPPMHDPLPSEPAPNPATPMEPGIILVEALDSDYS